MCHVSCEQNIIAVNKVEYRRVLGMTADSIDWIGTFVHNFVYYVRTVRNQNAYNSIEGNNLMFSVTFSSFNEKLTENY